jgi:hypothetical protein
MEQMQHRTRDRQVDSVERIKTLSPDEFEDPQFTALGLKRA